MAKRTLAGMKVGASTTLAPSYESPGSATRILIASATTLGLLILSIGLSGSLAKAAPASKTIASITPGANLSSLNRTRVSSVAAGAVGDEPCIVSVNAPSCSSDDTDLTVDVVNTGNTSGCVFTWSADWGDKHPAQTVTWDGAPSSGTYYLTNHIYQTLTAKNYSIAVTSVSVSGSCSAGNGSYKFALSPIRTVNCKPKVPRHVNLNVARVVYNEAARLGASRKVLLSAFEAAYVESHFNNCSNGDHSSVGVFQQLKSWGSVPTRENVADASDLYLDKAIKVARKHPTYTAAEIAQAVQKSRAPGRYAAARSEAESILSQMGSR